jgi:hypothetical protein
MKMIRKLNNQPDNHVMIQLKQKLASCYANGYGCEKNINKAIQLYRDLQDLAELDKLVTNDKDARALVIQEYISSNRAMFLYLETLFDKFVIESLSRIIIEFI